MSHGLMSQKDSCTRDQPTGILEYTLSIRDVEWTPIVDLAPYASVHTLFCFHQAGGSRYESGEFHGLWPVPLASEFVSSPIEAVPIAFNEVEVSNQDVERALRHIAS